jgi:hypothetical protein
MPAGRRRTGSPRSNVSVRVISYRPAVKPEPDSKPAPATALRQTSRPSRPGTPLHIPAPAAVITADSIEITLPVPPSINHQYATVRGRRVLSSAGRTYKQQAGQQLWLALSQSPHKRTLMQRLRTEPPSPSASISRHRSAATSTADSKSPRMPSARELASMTIASSKRISTRMWIERPLASGSSSPQPCNSALN